MFMDNWSTHFLAYMFIVDIIPNSDNKTQNSIFQFVKL